MKMLFLLFLYIEKWFWKSAHRKKPDHKQAVQVDRLEIVLPCEHKKTYNPSLGDIMPTEMC